MKTLEKYINESLDSDVVYNAMMGSQLFWKTLKEVFEQKGLTKIDTLDDLLKYLRACAKHVAANREEFYISRIAGNDMLTPVRGKGKFDIIGKIVGYMIENI